MAAPTFEPVLAEPSHGRRERNRRRTRQAIIRATLALVATRGFDAVTIEMIAEAAEVSPRTFSNYFTGKQEAFFATEPEPVDAIRAAFGHLPAGVPLLDTLRGVLAQIGSDISANAEAMQMRLGALHDQPRLAPAFLARFAEIEAVMAEQISLRLGVPGVPEDTDLRPRLLAGLVVSLIHGSLQHWRAGEQLDDLPAIITSSFDLLVQTLADLSRPLT